MSKNYNKYYKNPLSEETKEVSAVEAETKVESIPEPETKEVVEEPVVEAEPIPEPEKPTPEPTTKQAISKAIVKGAARVNVRENPSKASKADSILSEGTEVEIIEYTNEYWYKITDGKITGYMMSKFLKRI